MKLCRFQPMVVGAASVSRASSTFYTEPRFGLVSGETVIELWGDIYGSWKETNRTWHLDETQLLPPVAPGKVVCVGRNYREHAAELGNPVPVEPLIFLKPSTAVIGPGEPIVIPRISQRVDYEGELAVVMGRACAHLGAQENTERYVLGYTLLNDVTARDIQKKEGQFTRAKGFDTFCPLGPILESEFDVAGATVETWVNGQRRQFGHTREMIFAVDDIIRWISRMMTLLPGDVIATGTPMGVGELHAGDVVEVISPGIGTLRNPVTSQEAEA